MTEKTTNLMASAKLQCSIGKTKKASTRNPKAQTQAENKAYLVHSRDTLKPYERYRKLYGERKYQRPQKALSSSFLELPTELRLRIYICALVLPETGIGKQDFWQRRLDKKFYRRIFNRENVNLGFLRVCKQVNAEAAQVFYGQNEFRFSGTNGCIVAAAFVYTIKARNTHWLAHLTIAMPLLTEDRSIYANEGTASLPSKPYFKLAYRPDTNTVIWSGLPDLITAHPGMAVEVVSLWKEDDTENQDADEDGWSYQVKHGKVLTRLEPLVPVVHMGTEYESRGRWSVENARVVDLPLVAAGEK
ncbi:hypothetical protein E8E12_005295 [Didymella heteroderae]|uniref:Uncharacterized protein n=1 Tax=Didymella heteroderae TaxID=1769908 RepID=A0A9P5C0I6_9PLEO|nr:hypothetical protein E8E12_005295 [Didymella heteroderae]